MITGRLTYDILLALLFALTFASVLFSYNNWKRHRSRKMFWYLIILGSQLFMIGGILLINYLGLANTAYADSRLNIILDDSYWNLVGAFLKVVIIAVMMYGINQFTVYLMPIAVRGKKRLIAVFVLCIAVIILIFLIIIRKESSGRVFDDAGAVVNGLLYPIGCIIAGIQAVSVLIPSIAIQEKGSRGENLTGLILFIPFLVLPIMDFTWFAGTGMPSYIRLSYFAVLPMIVLLFRELRQNLSKETDSPAGNGNRFDFLCRKFEISEREKDVLLLIVGGKSQKDIADELCISVNTVKSHLQSIYKKMRVSSKIQLLLKINSANEADSAGH